MLYFGSWNRECAWLKITLLLFWYGCNPRNIWFCTRCGTSVWKLYFKTIFCCRNVIYKRSQISICSKAWATLQSTHDCRCSIEWLFKNNIYCLYAVWCNFYGFSCPRLCIAILWLNHIFVNVITVHTLVETFNVLPSKTKLVSANPDLIKSIPPVFSFDVLLSATANPMFLILSPYIPE